MDPKLNSQTSMKKPLTRKKVDKKQKRLSVLDLMEESDSEAEGMEQESDGFYGKVPSQKQ